MDGLELIRASSFRPGLRHLTDAEGITVTRGALSCAIAAVDAEGARPVTVLLGRHRFTGRLVEGRLAGRHNGRVWHWQCAGCRHRALVVRVWDGHLMCWRCARMPARVWAARTPVERAAQRLLRAEVAAARGQPEPKPGGRGAAKHTRALQATAVRAARHALQRARTEAAAKGLTKIRGV